MSEQVKQTIKDELGEWVISPKDGRKYINYTKGAFYDQEFKKKVTTALEGNLPQVEDPDKQESHNAFTHKGNTYSISQISGEFGVTNLVYQGAAKYAKKLIPLAGSAPGQQKLSNGDGNKNYNNNWKGGKSNWKAATITAPSGLTEPQLVTMEQANKLCNETTGMFMPPHKDYPPLYGEDGIQLYYIGKPVKNS